jgi:hypothetical protein
MRFVLLPVMVLSVLTPTGSHMPLCLGPGMTRRW